MNISRHTFHGIFSNSYDALTYYTSSPDGRLKATEAVRGEKIIFGGKLEPYADETSTLKEFASEGEAVAWFKKIYLGKEQYNKIADKALAKNYFKIPASEFHKCSAHFNGMTKGLKFNIDPKISYDGQAELKPNLSLVFGCAIKDGCHSRVGYIEVKSPSGEIWYSGCNSVIGVPATPGVTVSIEYDKNKCGAGHQCNRAIFCVMVQYGKKKVNLGKANLNNGSDGGNRGPFTFTISEDVLAKLGIQRLVKFKSEISSSIAFDSSKIFDISELESRIGANKFLYSKASAMRVEENENDLESLTINGRDVFQEKWSFDKTVFDDLFHSKFNWDTSYLNDPILLPFNSYYSISDPQKLRPDITSVVSMSITPSDDALNVFNSQKNLTKRSERFGAQSMTLSNNNVLTNTLSTSFSIKLIDVLYVKSLDMYLCFVDFFYRLGVDSSVARLMDDTEDFEKCEPSDEGDTSSTSSLSLSSLFDILDGPDGTVGLRALDASLNEAVSEKTVDVVLPLYSIFPGDLELTTDDQYVLGADHEFPTSECSDNTKIEFEPQKIKIKFDSFEAEFECHRIKQMTQRYDNAACEPTPDGVGQQTKGSRTYALSQTPIIEIIGWKDSDFSESNIFPPKIDGGG